MLLSAFLFFAAMPISTAQNLRVVEGRVVNDDGAPIEGAVISIKNYEQTFSSDVYGNFSIKIPYGYNYISAAHPNHIPASAEIDGSYVILRLKYDAAGVKSREEARMKAQQDSIKVAKKAEKERLAAEEKARKEAEAKAQAEAAAEAKAEKERLAAEEKARKKVQYRTREDTYNKQFKNKGISHSIDFSYVYEFSSSTCLLYKYSGYRSYDNLSPMQLTYTISYNFNRLVSLGIGGGALYNAKSITIVNDSFESPNEGFREKRLDVPVFLNLRVNMLRTKVRPYVSLSGGYYILSGTPMGEGGLGCEIRFSRRCAFRIQASASLVPWPWCEEDSLAAYIPTINPGIKIGFDF